TGAFVYAALWLGITAAYLAFTALLARAATERLPVGAPGAFTLGVAPLGQPARGRLGMIPHPWGFGDRLGGYCGLRRVGNLSGDAAKADQLGRQLASTVQQGLSATWVRIWVHGAAGPERLVAAEGPIPSADARAELSSDMVHASDVVGRVECGPKRRGDA